MTNATWLADVLRDAGLTVVEVDGWKARGRPGSFGPVQGVLLHHTGPTASIDGALDLIVHGRGGPLPLPGPLSHLVLDVDGTFYVTAAGRCNHAGKGRWQGVTDGNSHFVGIEARNPGDGSAWPTVQMDAYARGVAAILEHVDADDVMAVGHKEYAQPKGRKIDPTFDMIEFREAVERIMAADEPVMVLARPVAPSRAMLRKGAHGADVEQLQRLLGFRDNDVDGDFGPATDKAVRAFQLAKGLTPDGKVGPKTWAELGVK